MAQSLRAVLALSVALYVCLQPGFGLDSECHYFCHLDIIWVNTPSKMTLYGLGSPLSRRRRSPGRCACANPDDRTCTSFCQDSSQNPSLVLVNPSPPPRRSPDGTRSDLSAALRNAVHANLLLAELGVFSPRKKPSPGPQAPEQIEEERAGDKREAEQETPQRRGAEGPPQTWPGQTEPQNQGGPPACAGKGGQRTATPIPNPRPPPVNTLMEAIERLGHGP
ncbi:hypothetical protein AAFF_G00282050 [Aldrovandia affinis]|uniref:Endothelin-like toxin domain-containing protein n=1 Tax=Aldrovandia affinis TaxID=143900 RepID=A0AAD7W1R8_9TELE|nr:hypothetical protein AAFF_G00282050 [Aldrovandia affinis]